jgi:fucose 4-O-acetylase-like acetyltransferase
MTATATTTTRPTATRERWLDLCRAAALAVVVVGHILIAVVHRSPAGEVEVAALLDLAPWTHPVTWVVQVMAVFFAVGGYAAAGSVRARGVVDRTRWAVWAGGRAAALVAPALPLLALWLLAGPPLAAAVGTELVGTAASAALVPLWFLATYVLVQALVPLWVRVVDAGRAAPALLALLGGVAAVDALHLAGAPAVGLANFLLVWSVPTLLGVAVHAHRAEVVRSRLVAALPLVVVLALAGALWLVAGGGYDVPLVGVSDHGRSNNSPPSLLLAVHGLGYAAAVLHLGPRVEAWLGRGRRPAVLRAAAAWSMPLYLWHMTGLVVLAGVLLLVDVPVAGALVEATPLSGGWWALRVPTVLAVLAVTLVLVRLAGPASLASARRVGERRATSAALVAAGLLATSAGIGGLVLHGTATPPWGWAALVLGGLAATAGRRVAATAPSEAV